MGRARPRNAQSHRDSTRGVLRGWRASMGGETEWHASMPHASKVLNCSTGPTQLRQAAQGVSEPICCTLMLVHMFTPDKLEEAGMGAVHSQEIQGIQLTRQGWIWLLKCLFTLIGK